MVQRDTFKVMFALELFRAGEYELWQQPVTYRHSGGIFVYAKELEAILLGAGGHSRPGARQQYTCNVAGEG